MRRRPIPAGLSDPLMVTVVGAAILVWCSGTWAPPTSVRQRFAAVSRKWARMGIRIGVISTYPGTQCGIATFAESLVTNLIEAGADVGVIRIVDAPEAQTEPVVFQWITGRLGAPERVAEALADYDVALVQHEYGIFGGADGSDILEVVAQLRMPVISVLHTVLTNPTQHQRSVLARLCAASAGLVTMTETARQRLISGWGVHPSRVFVITHGAVANLADAVPHRQVLSSPPKILTWGLLGEGKGIEWALQALARLQHLSPTPQYRVVGQTHPRVLERDGEAYRDRLLALTARLGLTNSVRFDGHYLPGPELRQIVRDADIILLPYDSREQVTSGVLTEAVAAGKPIVSTSFPHAVELLSGGVGLLVPQRDPEFLARALGRVLTERGLAERMAVAAQGLAASLLWPAVATRYIDLASSTVAAAAQSVA